MILDLHAHLYSPRWYPGKLSEYLVSDFISRQEARGSRPSQAQARTVLTRMMADDSGETTLRIMDKAGIDQRVVLIVDWGLELGEAETPIEKVHEEVLAICRRSQSRLLGFAGIDPRRPNAIELVARSFDQWGAVGLKLHPTGAWELGDERTHAVVSLAAVRGRPILVHIGHTMQILSDKNSQPEAFIRLARDFPNGKFIAGHSGFELFPQFLRGGIPENIFFDISGWQELVGDDAGLLKSNLDRLLEAFPGRVGFGTDSPFFSYNLISQEARWLAMVRRYVEDSPHRAQWRADEVLTCPAALRTAMRS